MIKVQYINNISPGTSNKLNLNLPGGACGILRVAVHVVKPAVAVPPQAFCAIHRVPN